MSRTAARFLALIVAPMSLSAMASAQGQSHDHAHHHPAPTAPAPAAAETCPTVPTPLPAEFASWSTPQPITAAVNESGLASAEVKLGHAVVATLSAAPQFPLTPEKPADVGTRGGLFVVQIAEAGTYRVALGAKAWIDLVQGKAAIASAAHGHGPGCSGIRKIVDFAVTPGRYLLQISGAAGDTIPLLVTKKP